MQRRTGCYNRAQKQVQQIPGVQPTSYEAHWDHAAWDPVGSRLAISHLNGRETKDGITLYLVDAITAQVTYSQKMDLASEQSAPYVEWVSNEVILINGPNALFLLDFHSSPPRQIDVMKEVFNLELNFPDQISSNASILSSDGNGYHLAVWANHPHNQNLFLYHAENGQISVYQPKDQAVLIFPDGQWTPMTRIEDIGQAQGYSFAGIGLTRPGFRSISRLAVINRADTHAWTCAICREHRSYYWILPMGCRLSAYPMESCSTSGKPALEAATAPYLSVSPDGKTALSIARGGGHLPNPTREVKRAIW